MQCCTCNTEQAQLQPKTRLQSEAQTHPSHLAINFLPQTGQRVPNKLELFQVY